MSPVVDETAGDLLVRDMGLMRGGLMSTLSGSEGGTVAVVDFWTRLYPPVEPTDSGAERAPARAAHKIPAQITLGWEDTTPEELHDYGGAIPNELVVILEHCVGLSACWPGLLPDLPYRLYDLPPHSYHTMPCSADPVFNHSTCYPLAVTADVLNYFRCSSLWVYVFDDSDDQMPPVYLAKTPVPLRVLAGSRRHSRYGQDHDEVEVPVQT